MYISDWFVAHDMDWFGLILYLALAHDMHWLGLIPYLSSA